VFQDIRKEIIPTGQEHISELSAVLLGDRKTRQRWEDIAKHLSLTDEDYSSIVNSRDSLGGIINATATLSKVFHKL